MRTRRRPGDPSERDARHTPGARSRPFARARAFPPRSRMPAIDFGSLLAAERDRRRCARAGAAIPASAEAPAPSTRAPVVIGAGRARISGASEGAQRSAPASGSCGACTSSAAGFLSSAEETSLARAGVPPRGALRDVPRGGRSGQNHGGSPSSRCGSRAPPAVRRRPSRRARRRGRVRAVAAPNHVLVNEYLRPAGIAPHSDERRLPRQGRHRHAGGAALMDFWPNDGSAALEKGAERSDGVGAAGKDENRSSPSRSERPSNDPLPSAQVWLKPRARRRRYATARSSSGR